MPRLIWVAWGLLVVTLDLPLAGWDVLPDVVGWAWVFYGLGGAATVSPAFVRARAAALVGMPVWVVTGTPLFVDARWLWLQVAALTVEIVVWTLAVHQVASGVLAGLPEGEADTTRWAARLRTAALVVGGLQLVALAAYGVVPVLYPLAFLLSVVVGVLAVVLVQRVARAGWLAGARA